MNELENRRSIRSALLLLASVYLLNGALVATSFVISVGALGTHAFLGRLRPTVSYQVSESLIGFFMGEIGCIALWATISNRSLLLKVAVYLFAALQLAILCKWVHRDSSVYLLFFGIVITLLLVTWVGVRTAAGRVCLVDADAVLNAQSHKGVTIAQAIFFTAAIAITLAANSAENAAASTSAGHLLRVIRFGVGTGWLVIAGLMIATTFRRFWFQVSLCLVLAALVTILVAEGSRSSWNHFFSGIPVLIWIVLLPVVWIRILRRLGYVIRFVDGKPMEVTDNPWKLESEGA